eukprot:TRINITY_DN1914_c0_g1_i1.p3 TRINITY_DN1914_c0_g1~~TRINITY_DN1914_c0_g1_i1.p3  ORF type:complete len:55 (+),score=3.79 TRINITY_DN1914_c0_g1_i1:216-380(+)
MSKFNHDPMAYVDNIPIVKKKASKLNMHAAMYIDNITIESKTKKEKKYPTVLLR